MYIYGKNTVMEAMKNRKQIEQIYLSTSNKEMFSEFQKYCQGKKIPFEVMPLNKMNQLFEGNHQGVVAKIEDYKYKELSKLLKEKENQENVALIILDGLEDPHNLGAILRTADATKMDGIIIPKNHSVGLNGTVAKVSTGAIEYVPVAQVTNLVQTIGELKKKGYWVIGLDMDGSIDYKKQDYSGKIAVVQREKESRG